MKAASSRKNTGIHSMFLVGREVHTSEPFAVVKNASQGSIEIKETSTLGSPLPRAQD